MLTELLNSIFMDRLSLVPLTNDASTMRLYYDYPLCRDAACQGDCVGGCEGTAVSLFDQQCTDGTCRGDCVGAYEGAISGFHW